MFAQMILVPSHPVGKSGIQQLEGAIMLTTTTEQLNLPIPA